MKLPIKFKETNSAFHVDFGALHNVSDGGFERGYDAGYKAGYNAGYLAGTSGSVVATAVLGQAVLGSMIIGG